ncbi:MAG: YHS domain-containing protein, partial [Burkholderiales bacterium]
MEENPMTNHDHHAAHDHHTSHNAGCCGSSKGPAQDAMEKDPVCGMFVDPASTPHHATHAGNQYHFCSAGCRTKFVAHPGAYLNHTSRPEPQAVPGAIWTCPMHPKIRQEGPGTCP